VWTFLLTIPTHKRNSTSDSSGIIGGTIPAVFSQRLMRMVLVPSFFFAELSNYTLIFQ